MESPWSAISSQEARTPSSSPCPVARSDDQAQKALEPYELVIRDGPMQCSIFLPQELESRGCELEESFAKSVTNSARNRLPCSSKLELCSEFLGNILAQMDHSSRQYSRDMALLLRVLHFVQGTILEHDNINTVLASMDGEEEQDKRILSIYFKCCALDREMAPEETGRFVSSSQNGIVKPFALFNGQGVETYFEELTKIHEIYQHQIGSLMRALSDKMMRLAADDRARNVVPHGLDVETWLRRPETRPGIDYLTTAAVSMPLIAYSQIFHYAIACVNLHVSPGDLRQCFVGATGHSQGVIVAAFIAAADSWDTLFDAAQQVIEVLFRIGVRCQQTLPIHAPLEALQHDSPSSYMLSVKGLSRETLQAHIDEINPYLPVTGRVHIALVNGPRQIVIAGTPDSLRAMDKKVRSVDRLDIPQLNSAKVPFSQRQPLVTTRLLAISAPFHSPYLEEAARLAKEDLSAVILRGDDLAIPVFHTRTARNLQSSRDLIPELIDMVCTEVVEWESLTNTVLSGATHVLDFGPGGDAGIGSSLVSRQRDGTGLRTIVIGSHKGTNESVGYAGEIYTRNGSIQFDSVWETDYAPRLVQTTDGDRGHMVDTKFSRFLGVPPLMVGAMTPTTTSPAFVAAILNARYHAELACGGFPDEASMRQGILSLVAAIAPGRDITCNIIYANPRATAWQIPLLAELRRSGIPITGLTIGAGVPSLEVVQGYVTDLSLKHIAFKPGSKDAIDAVLEIADGNPTLPIILQWTGGRGGGHHSCEDFHEPILDRYGQIRSRSNVILVAGSGFGDADGTYPYLTGTWSSQFGRPPMPFDAILLGSRVMAAREAQTSDAAKDAICRTAGVDDARWEMAMQGPAGGIISVRSEMGEPIHKLATRGVLLWAELDRDIFSLPREKQKEALLKRKDYYIKRLNDDFQKVWFGCNAHGEPIDLHEMTYAEVLQRLIALLYLEDSQEWIDSSFRTLVWDFMKRMESRLGSRSVKPPRRHEVIQTIAQLDRPWDARNHLLTQYPVATHEVITAADAEYVIILSRRRGQKPVPYVILLDEDFEYWFKKDSLWQSERLEAVPGQDVGRTCILHGPVAARYTRECNEPVRQILDGIQDTHIARILASHYCGSMDIIPECPARPVAYLGQRITDRVTIEDLEDGAVVHYSLAHLAAEHDSEDSWLNALAGASSASWFHGALTETTIVQGRNVVTNPIRKLFVTSLDCMLEIHKAWSNKDCHIILKEMKDSQTPEEEQEKVTVARASLRSGPEAEDIILTLWDHGPVGRHPVPMKFQFRCLRHGMYCTMHEVMTGRDDQIKEYYRSIWIGKNVSAPPSPDFLFRGEQVTLSRDGIRQFSQSICRYGLSSTSDAKGLMRAPLDMAITVAWKPIISCLFPSIVAGDMLRLLHMSNSFELCDGVDGLKEGDNLTSDARLSAIRIKAGSGKIVETQGTIYRDGTPVVNVRSTFMLLGHYTDYSKTFELKTENFRLHLSSLRDIILLQSRQWFFIADKVDLHDYLHSTIDLEITSRYSYEDSNAPFHLSVQGKMIHVSEAGLSTILGSISLPESSVSDNPVTGYLRRHAIPSDVKLHMLDQPRKLVEDFQVTILDQAAQYAQTSGDGNPIHLSELFARYAGHDSRVTHGMFTSGLVRGIVEAHLANDNPTRMRSWSCNFEGKVSPGDRLSIRMDHIGMSDGKMLINVRAHATESGLPVLTAQAVIEQTLMAYVFTGQGSQQAGMGMELDKQSPTARQVWDAADKYFEGTYGFSIRQIVQDNPKTLTVHFGGTRGRTIRDNYMALAIDHVGAAGEIVSKPVFPEINKSTRSYTFRSMGGLLHETQFTQPAMALMEIARFYDMKNKGLINNNSLFAGHSLGEYMALTAMGNLLTIEKLAGLVFYRGLTMQNAVDRDSNGATNYSMCAVDPSRVSKDFTEADLHWCVAEIARSTDALLEIVNYNIVNMQYVCAGELRALSTLTSVLNSLASGSLQQSRPDQFISLIQAAISENDRLQKPITLQRGRATIPLKVNVPFHSSLLKQGVDSFRQLLRRHLPEDSLDPNLLIDKYIPNLTGKPFQLSKVYIEEVLDLTKSPVLDEVVRNWPLSDSNTPIHKW